MKVMQKYLHYVSFLIRGGDGVQGLVAVAF